LRWQRRHNVHLKTRTYLVEGFSCCFEALLCISERNFSRGLILVQSLMRYCINKDHNAFGKNKFTKRGFAKIVS